MKSKVPQNVKDQIRKAARSLVRPEIGEIDFGDLRRLTPISKQWGFDRGLPIDRYYIESFLSKHSSDITGRVLEFGEDLYATRFGNGRVSQTDILDVRKENARATWVADLANAPSIPSSIYDSILCIQTLQLIRDIPAALQTLHRILLPNGKLLATFPGITHTKDPDWEQSWFWSFTPLSAAQLFGERFPAVQVEAFGNVLSAISFLHGIAAEELSEEELNFRDPGFDVIIAVRAVKTS